MKYSFETKAHITQCNSCPCHKERFGVDYCGVTGNVLGPDWGVIKRPVNCPLIEMGRDDV